MKFLKNLFGKKENFKSSQVVPITVYEFWNWFEQHESKFFKAIKVHNNIEAEFIDPVYNKLNQVKEGIFILAGMLNDHTAELIITAEGNLLNFPHIKKIVESAPKLQNWKFTAFKPSSNSPDFGIQMGTKSFTDKNVYFFPENNPLYPDEISIKLVYKERYDQNEFSLIVNGIFIFVENYLGEIKQATQVDRISIEHSAPKEVELIPISKLNDYINWREKEFEEKYNGTFLHSDESKYTSLEWEIEDKVIIGVVNADLIKWDKKASHPWIVVIIIKFDEKKNNGMPNPNALQLYYEFEDRVRDILPDKEGYLHVAQKTGLGKREIFYANKDFMKPIQVLQEMKNNVSFEYEIDVFKDKYWQCMKQFEH